MIVGGDRSSVSAPCWPGGSGTPVVNEEWDIHDDFTKERSLKQRPSEADSTAVQPTASFRCASPWMIVPGVKSGARTQA